MDYEKYQMKKDLEKMAVTAHMMKSIFLIIFLLFVGVSGKWYLAYINSTPKEKRKFFKSYNMRTMEMKEKQLEIIHEAVVKLQDKNVPELIEVFKKWYPSETGKKQ